MRHPILSVVTFGLTFALVGMANARPDLNAFVNRKITNTKSLLVQVRNDGEVADRYQRHFAMNKHEILAYLGDLHRGTLEKPGVYTIYSVPEGGNVKMHVGKLRKGEPVFLDSKGKPILIAKCGNPVVLGPVRVRRGNPLAVVPSEDSDLRELTDDSPRFAEVETGDDLMAMVPPVPDLVPLALNPDLPMVFADVPAMIVPASSIAGGFPWLAGAPLLFPLVGSSNGSDGGGTISPSPVPEPGTLAAFGLGAMALGARRRRT